ncbi:MAG: SusD/RagB family nutrient-binding outer membrane lipoprotein [Agriterribacter sp.]
MSSVINFKYKNAFWALILIFLASCSRDKFAEMNTDPDAVLTIDPEKELTPGQLSMVNSDFEAFYDYVRNINPWVQVYVNTNGNSATFMETGGNINNRWGIFYGGVGYNLSDVIHLVDIMPDDEKAQYQQLRAIAGVSKAYYAFYVADANGSIPYSQAFQARYTIPALLTPAYDTQEALFDTLDAQLKAYAAVLKATPGVAQKGLNTNDIYYQGNATNWYKAANSLRLRIAMRLMKRNPTKLTSIANEVINDGLISSIDEEWILNAGPGVGNGGDRNPVNQANYSGEINTVDFMWKAQDPRARVFYQQSGIASQAMFDSAKAQGKIPASMTWDGQLIRGQFADPNADQNPANAAYFGLLNFSFNGIAKSVYLSSIIQPRLTYPAYNGGAGTTVFPLITYADVCLMRAELVVRGLSNDPESAEDLYKQGITASITDYDKWAKVTQIDGYTALGSDEIANYLEQPGVAYDEANALEQICVQQYLNFFMQPNENWSLLKRTGLPGASGVIMPLEDVSAFGEMPRRYPVTYPSQADLNFTNITNAIDQMRSDPDFGEPTSLYGRVWWDKK